MPDQRQRHLQGKFAAKLFFGQEEEEEFFSEKLGVSQSVDRVFLFVRWMQEKVGSN